MEVHLARSHFLSACALLSAGGAFADESHAIHQDGAITVDEAACAAMAPGGDVAPSAE
jgi:hypothetical protein